MKILDHNKASKYFIIGLMLILTLSILGCSSNKDPVQATQASPTAKVEITAEEKAKIEAEAKIKAEAEAKAAEEAKAKKEAEDKAKKVAEAKAKAEEEAKKKENFEKTKYANHAQLAIPAITEDAVELNQKTYDFIVSNYKLFPAQDDADIKAAKDMTDKSINAKLLNKNAAPYFDKMASFSGTVVTIEETQLEDNTTLATLHVMDDNGFSYQLLLYKSTGDILEEDDVRCWGVPVGPWSFANVSGGYTNVQFFLGSHVEKLK
ncbi:hypothetical protein [Paenibacillus albiflavus]|uniref:hypothetical protein n=1 Tax=Paenibacillus albiflavus TaxID=2545760 RepID=UPI001A9FCB9C|nr:hypothetical protein [Paenibacillus albiflavus]